MSTTGNHKLVITEEDGFIRYGYFRDGVPVELYCEPQEQESLVGNIYAARVERIADGIGGAFLEIGKKEKCYFRLPKNGQPVKLSPGHEERLYGGDIILVQITKDAVKTKLPVADGNVSLHGKYLVLTLADRRCGVSRKIQDNAERKRLSEISSRFCGEDFGVIIRTNAMGVPETALIQEYQMLRERYEEIMRRAAIAVGRTLLYREPPHYLTLGEELPAEELDEIVTDSPAIYEELCQYYRRYQEGYAVIRLYTDAYPLEKLYRFAHFYEEALGKNVWLPSGGSLVIEPTEAMVVIDVNSGGVTKQKKHKERIFYEMNREAAVEIARQLRLRNLSGIIVIDFINMDKKEERQAILSLLEEECKKDRVNCRVIDMTALGLVEMIREKQRKPLHEQMQMSKCIKG